MQAWRAASAIGVLWHIYAFHRYTPHSAHSRGPFRMATSNVEAMKQYRHIFFDLDRTLWDFDAAAEVAFERIYEKYGLKERGIPSAHDFHEVYHPLNEQLWVLYRANQITKDDLNRTRFLKPLEHYGIHDIELADHLSEDYVYWSPRIVRLVTGTMGLLDYLRPKYHLHIITNGFQEIQHTKLNGSGLEPYFETLTVSEEVGVKKPNPEIFLYALRNAGLADVVISRAGAMSISELSLVQKPVIFVPLPTAAEDHQTKNAQRLVEADAAIMVNNAETETKLIPTLKALVADPEKMERMKANIGHFARPNAADDIVDQIIKAIG